MLVVVSPSAKDDLDDAWLWWREHRTEAPLLLLDEVAEAFSKLEQIATTLPVFARVGPLVIRRLHLARVHRHIYYVVATDRVLVLAVWGSVRGVLPKLNARARQDR